MYVDITGGGEMVAKVEAGIREAEAKFKQVDMISFSWPSSLVQTFLELWIPLSYVAKW